MVQYNWYEKKVIAQGQPNFFLYHILKVADIYRARHLSGSLHFYDLCINLIFVHFLDLRLIGSVLLSFQANSNYGPCKIKNSNL